MFDGSDTGYNLLSIKRPDAPVTSAIAYWHIQTNPSNSRWILYKTNVDGRTVGAPNGVSYLDG